MGRCGWTIRKTDTDRHAAQLTEADLQLPVAPVVEAIAVVAAAKTAHSAVPAELTVARGNGGGGRHRAAFEGRLCCSGGTRR